MIARRIVLAALLAAGCYSSGAAPGSYQCPDDGACPSNLKCVCGMCVRGNGDEACSFAIEPKAPACPAPNAANGCVVEGRPFQVTVTAYTSKLPDPNAKSTYSGAVTLGSSWGHARPTAPFVLSGGTATADVTLDRATPPNTTALLDVRAGTGYGESVSSLVVDPPRFVADPQGPALESNGATHWAKATIGYPTIDHTASGYTMYFAGAKSLTDGKSGIGSATSSDGITWQAATDPILYPENFGSFYLSPSALRLSDTDVRLFYSEVTFANPPTIVVREQRSLAGAAFAPVADARLDATSCPFCASVGSMTEISLLLDPEASNHWLLYFNLIPAAGKASATLGVARSGDEGKSWHLDPVPTPASGQILAVNFATTPRVVYDAKSALYRMFYAQVRINLAHSEFSQPCDIAIEYATSLDGQFWTGVRESPVISPKDIPWAAAHNPLQSSNPYTGVVPGAIETDTDELGHLRYTLWYHTLLTHGEPFGCDPTRVIDKGNCPPCPDKSFGCDPQKPCCAKTSCESFAIGRATTPSM